MASNARETITLDSTVADIYTSICAAHNKKPVLYFYPPAAFDAASKEINASKRFLYQASLAGFSHQALLTIFSQPIAFTAGPVDVLMFEDEKDETRSIERHVSKLVALLAENQRPQLHFLRIAGQQAAHDAIKKILGSDGMLVTNRPDDWCEGLCNLVDLDVQYKLESKLVLHESPVPTPDGQVFWLDVSENAERRASSWSRIETELSSRPLPFVVKVTHSGGGVGVFIAGDEDRRAKMLEGLKELQTVDRMVSDARYLAAGETPDTVQAVPILVTDYITGPTLSIVFAVTNDVRKSHALGVMDQVLLPNGISWLGVCIDFSRQEELEAQFAGLIETTTRWMHAEGFRGLACVDLLVDQNGDPRVIDLNPRFGGAAPLCFVQSHFQGRGCNVVYLSRYDYAGPLEEAERIVADLAQAINLFTLSRLQMTPEKSTMSIFVGGANAQQAAANRQNIIERFAQGSS